MKFPIKDMWIAIESCNEYDREYHCVTLYKEVGDDILIVHQMMFTPEVMADGLMGFIKCVLDRPECSVPEYMQGWCTSMRKAESNNV